MKLFVLEYKLANTAYYLGPDGHATMKTKWAQKFETKESAEAFKEQHAGMWMYRPVEIEFEENENEFLKAGNG